jgi:inner membrane protein COX18
MALLDFVFRGPQELIRIIQSNSESGRRTDSLGPSIIAYTVLVRGIITLPLNIYTLRRSFAIQTQAAPWVNILKQTRMSRQAKQERFKQGIRALPSLRFLSLSQVPVFLISSLAIRDLLSKDSSETAHSFLWLKDLRLIDYDSYLLPFTITLTNLMNLYLNQHMKRVKFGHNFGLAALNLIMFPVAVNMPSGLNLYWATSSSFSLLQNLLLSSVKVRRLLKIS